MENEKIYFTPGDTVRCKQLPDAPLMYVLHKKEITFKNAENKSKILQGIVCRWFTKDGFVQEATFNTKDIELIK